MATPTLESTTRELTGKKVKLLRLKKQLPAVVYGHGLETKPVTITLHDFKKIYSEAGTSTLVDLKIDENKPIKVLLQQPQVDYMSGEPIHADFYAVKMTEKLETAIPIKYIGESPAVLELEGNFIANKNELNIRCLPADLIPEVEVDISILKTFEDQIRINDLKLPETIEVLDDPEETIALVSAPISEEELEAELAEPAAEEETAAVEALAGEEEATEGEESSKSDKSEEPEITEEKSEKS